MLLAIIMGFVFAGGTLAWLMAATAFVCWCDPDALSYSGMGQRGVGLVLFLFYTAVFCCCEAEDRKKKRKSTEATDQEGK